MKLVDYILSVLLTFIKICKFLLASNRKPAHNKQLVMCNYAELFFVLYTHTHITLIDFLLLFFLLLYTENTYILRGLRGKQAEHYTEFCWHVRCFF